MTKAQREALRLARQQIRRADWYFWAAMAWLGTASETLAALEKGMKKARKPSGGRKA